MITWIATVKFFDYTVNMMVHADTESEAMKNAAFKVANDYGFPCPKVTSIKKM